MTKTEVITKLKEIVPLSNYHYGWILPPASDTLLYEYARIAHSLGLYHRWATAAQIDKCVRILSSLPASNLPPVLSFTIRPWHEKFDPALPPTDIGPTCQAEIDLLVSRCEFIKTQLALANAKYGSNIQVGAFLLDSERFVVKAGDLVWNQAIIDKYDIFNTTLKAYFPTARLEWFAKDIVAGPSLTGWSRRPWHVDGEWLERLSQELYRPWEPTEYRQAFALTAKLADSLGLREVTPWVSLACGFVRHPSTGIFHTWSWDVRYDLVYSWMCGAELNHPWYGTMPERFLDNTRIKAVCFYPGIGDSHVPKSWEHFIAYCRGAADMQNLEDLK